MGIKLCLGLGHMYTMHLLADFLTCEDTNNSHISHWLLSSIWSGVKTTWFCSPVLSMPTKQGGRLSHLSSVLFLLCGKMQ